MEIRRNWAYKEIVRIISEFDSTGKIDGKIFREEERNRFNTIASQCVKLFMTGGCEAEIEVEELSNEKPFVGITVHLDVFELNENNKDDFIKLTRLADEVIFYGDEENYFHITFYVNGAQNAKPDRTPGHH